MIIKKFRKICGLVAIAGLSAITTFPAMSATDAEINPFKTFHMHALFTYQKPVYKNYNASVTFNDGQTMGVNANNRSLTGRLVYPFADLFLVQWESLLELYPKAKYVGGIF